MSKNSLKAKSRIEKIKFVNVSSEYVKRRNHNIVLRLVNFIAYQNEITVLVGSSGSGKTTLLRTILGFQDYGGMIYLDGTDIESIPFKERRLAYVSQQKTLYPNLTIFDNLAFPLKNEGLSSNEIKQHIQDIAKMFNIEILLTRKPRHLSGGQKQKVAFIKAFLSRPDIYLLDEPFSELSNDMKKEMIDIILKIKEEYQATFLIASHDIGALFFDADQIIVLDEGSVIQSGSPEELWNKPINEKVKAILGQQDDKNL